MTGFNIFIIFKLIKYIFILDFSIPILYQNIAYNKIRLINLINIIKLKLNKKIVYKN